MLQPKVCSMSMSQQRYLMTFRKELLTVEIKIFMVLQFSLMIYSIFGLDSEKSDLMGSQSVDLFISHTTKDANQISDALSRASTHLYQCDPDSYVENTTFHQFTNTFQGYIANKADLATACARSLTCHGYESVTTETNDRCTADMDYCRGSNKCKQVYNCKYLGDKLDVCESNSKIRRYEFASGSGITYGKKSGNYSCKEEKTLQETMGLIGTCVYCYCFCDDDKPNSDRYFYMKPYVANREANEVVTGVRFVKVNQMIHLQIQTGRLLPSASVDVKSVSWKPIDNIKIDDVYSDGGDKYYVFRPGHSFLDLDIVMAEQDDMVVTGRITDCI